MRFAEELLLANPTLYIMLLRKQIQEEPHY